MITLHDSPIRTTWWESGTKRPHTDYQRKSVMRSAVELSERATCNADGSFYPDRLEAGSSGAKIVANGIANWLRRDSPSPYEPGYRAKREYGPGSSGHRRGMPVLHLEGRCRSKRAHGILPPPMFSADSNLIFASLGAPGRELGRRQTRIPLPLSSGPDRA